MPRIKKKKTLRLHEMNVNARNLQAMLAKRETTHKGYTFILQGDIL